VDGHNYLELLKIFQHLKTSPRKPTAILAHTIAGKGVSFMEENYLWHGKPPNDEEARSAVAELTNYLDSLEKEPQDD
jgi:transketolase